MASFSQTEFSLSLSVSLCRFYDHIHTIHTYPNEGNLPINENPMFSQIPGYAPLGFPVIAKIPLYSPAIQSDQFFYIGLECADGHAAIRSPMLT